MRSHRIMAAAALALMAVPALVSAQRPARQAGPGDFQRMLETNPLWELLDAKERLDLTETQTAELERRAKALDEANADHLAKIRDMRAQRPGRGNGPPSAEDRERMRAAMEAARPHMQAVRESHREALQEARALFSAEQAAALDRLLQERREQRRGDRRGPPRR